MPYDQDADDRDFEANAAYDYKIEAYGDRCPCGTLRWGGDCPNCMKEEDYNIAPTAGDREYGDIS